MATATTRKRTRKVRGHLPERIAPEGLVIAPSGHPEAVDNRVYQCLNTKCLAKGSVNDGTFSRHAKNVTVCNFCGHDDNRWVREVGV